MNNNRLHLIIATRNVAKQLNTSLHVPAKTSFALIAGIIAFEQAGKGFALEKEIRAAINLSYGQLHKLLTIMVRQGMLRRTFGHSISSAGGPYEYTIGNISKIYR